MQGGAVIAEVVQEGLRMWWAPALAFAAGAVSFASPCVLPLVPGYLAFLGGGGVPGGKREATLAAVALFVLGFSLVFTLAFGLVASELSRWLRSSAGQRIAGLVVIGFGVFMILYALRTRVPWLYTEGRPLLSRVRPDRTAAFPMGMAFPLGMAFAIGWTPCIGPVLGVILTIAASEGGTGRAILLLSSYSLGLGIPFLLVAMGVGRIMSAARFFSRNYRWFAGMSGGLLVTVGTLLVTGAWLRVLGPLLRIANGIRPPI